MKIVLINSPIYDQNETEMAGNEYLPPFGLGYLATKIKEQNLEVDILDAIQLGLNAEHVLQRLHEIKPEIIGINIFSVNIPIVKRIIESYNQKVKFLIGGQCTKFIYEEIIKWNTLNELVVIIGEGDLIISDVIKDTVSESPLYQSKGRKVFQVDSKSKYFPENINLLHLDRDLLNENFVENYYGLKERSIITSRGCNYNCAFCGAAKSLNQNNKTRLKDKSVIISEISALVKTDPTIQCIRVLDDLFLKNSQSIQDAIEIFCQFHISWRAMAHIKTFDNVPEELLVKMKNSGCKELFIGIESGSDKVRKKINKVGTVNEIKNTTKKLLKCGIDIKGYFIFGLPTESESDMEMTLNLATSIYEYSKKSVGNFRTSVFQFRPYHGTALFNEISKNGDVLKYRKNLNLSSVKDRGQFNFYTHNHSECKDNILYDFIRKTSMLGENYDQGDNELQ